MQEEEFFSHGHIKVTKARFIVADQTYAMSGITSVAKSKESPRHGLPVATVVIGILVAVVGAQNSAPGGIMLGVVFALAGGAFLILRKPSYVVTLRTASGDQKALADENEHLITKVVEALNKAIVERG